MQQNDKNNFINAMVVEVAAHKECEHWTMFPRLSLPVGAKQI